MCPLERMVIETDSPYLTPVPNRGRRNDSSNLKYVIDKIAEVKGVSASEVERATFENGKKALRYGGYVMYEPKIILSGAPNARDLGGIGNKGRKNAQIRPTYPQRHALAP